MWKRASIGMMAVALGTLLAVLAVGTLRSAAVPQKSTAPKHQDNVGLGTDEVKRLMLSIAPNERGKITKEEWMKFMEAEFDRLDTDKSGELDARELSQSQLLASPFAKAGK